MTARRALVLAGGGRRADRWHDLAATGHAVGTLLAAHGLDVRLTSRLADVVDDDGFGTDLLVVACSDAGDDATSDPAAVDPATIGRALDAHVAAGRPVLALHSASIAFPDVPRWAEILGARWVAGTSMHPDLGPTTVDVVPGPWGVGTLLDDIAVTDERYSFLELVETAGPVEPHVTHEHDGVVHPLAWARETGPAGARVVYDALGHDVRSYASPSRRALLDAEVRWLLRR